jgi:hypothetical protein
MVSETAEGRDVVDAVGGMLGEDALFPLQAESINAVVMSNALPRHTANKVLVSIKAAFLCMFLPPVSDRPTYGVCDSSG